MAAGGSASRRAQEARRHERELREQWQAARRQARRWEAGSEGERRVAAQLLVLTERGWRLLVDRRWPGTRSGNVDMLLVGPGGVFVIDVKNWRSAPDVTDGRLSAGGESRDSDVGKLLAVTRTTEHAVASLGLSPVAVQPLMVFAGRRVNSALGRIRLLGEYEVGPALLSEKHRLRSAMIRAIADHLEHVFPAYEGSAVDADARSGTDAAAIPRQPMAPAPVADGLFDADGLREAAMEAARRAPIEQWMTFLHPDQIALVRRRWAGPARISGPAGTGKTVVALHRAAYLAQRTTGQILYVTFANNLPRVQSTFLQTMAPAVADRVHFHSLHAWAQEFLHERGIPTRLHGDKAETAFSHAWKNVGRDSCLTEIDPAHRYWQEEIDYVIKGRGITDFNEYAVLPRRRRLAGLRRTHREAVWALFEAYEHNRTERGVHDFNDILTLAHAEARAHPDRSPYGAVIVDEVQDLTLVGVQLLHALVGDAPNGLLLVGDGQQAVYPGGFRLSDAGVDIRGDRGQVLRTNYRNAKEILDAALNIVAEDAFEDIDGTHIPGRRDVDLTYHDGRVIRIVKHTITDHDRALLDALRPGDTPRDAATSNPNQLQGTREDWGDMAVLCPSLRAVSHYQRLLGQAGIPVCLLERYDGHTVEAVKLGSYRRAKGLEFKHVYLPQHDAALRELEEKEETARERGELARRQLFVAMTRARDTLWIGSVRPEKPE
ncbi:nuclease-related domain-containing DEAD/DEAH box helicase [Streptomyces sp. RKAG337]|uniref:nuclease-related domain-containing DEAD/DEAH box helicase n=1 Tax=Streptomyces sp. RKAG337 TaxID=2893404 RepID=UPI002033C997|nr:UvrD-helicase domain-containing protein [Streptomyces sp. RKAG337]MCM2424820.1 AAA family ATPase [Streptomyces sp. RKAG337]